MNKYLDNEIEKTIKKMRDNFRKNKTHDWNRIRIYLYKLKDRAFGEGVYAGKPQ